MKYNEGQKEKCCFLHIFRSIINFKEAVDVNRKQYIIKVCCEDIEGIL